MNRSGQAVGAVARYYRIPIDRILVVHDDLDLPPGTVRLKQGGGHGGHNGLRDIIQQLGDNGFWRARIGIGHPGEAAQVINYVLARAPAAEEEALLAGVDAIISQLPAILAGEFQAVMNQLHRRVAAPDTIS
jgi:PTH1 family peptidyl-tRNA hydrolase